MQREVPILSYAADEVALAALREREETVVRCSICEDAINGEPTSTGLLMWTRGDDVRFEEPPVCTTCANTLTVSAYTRWAPEDDYD